MHRSKDLHSKQPIDMHHTPELHSIFVSTHVPFGFFNTALCNWTFSVASAMSSVWYNIYKWKLRQVTFAKKKWLGSGSLPKTENRSEILEHQGNWQDIPWCNFEFFYPNCPLKEIDDLIDELVKIVITLLCDQKCFPESYFRLKLEANVSYRLILSRGWL